MRADIPTLRSMRPEPARDRSGKYLLPHPVEGTTGAWERATTLAGMHEDHGSLEKWKLRKNLQGVATKPELLEAVLGLVAEVDTADGWRAAGPPKRALDRIAETACDIAGAYDGSTWGTLLHTITEWADAGRLDEVIEEIRSWGEQGESLLTDLDVYQKTMANNGLTCPPEYIERIMVNTKCNSAGTMDRLIRLPDGRLVVGDLKTQKDMDFGMLKIAGQLAEYAFADGLVTLDGTSIEPMPADLDPTMSIVMHLPVGKATCDLIVLGPQEMELGWSLAQHAAQTMWFRSIAKGVRGLPYDPSSVTTPAGLLSEITYAESLEHLTAIWARVSSRRVWTDEHTAAAKSRKTELAKLRLRA
jgi:hypothetical protein